MELTIFRRDAPTGTLRIEDAGLYRILSARIAPGPEILRLYLDGRAFGVFCPEDGAMTLHRRVSRAVLPSMPNRAAAWCPSDGLWTPAEDGLIRFLPGGPVRAIRWRTDGPMNFFAAPERMNAFRHGDEIYLAAISK